MVTKCLSPRLVFFVTIILLFTPYDVLQKTVNTCVTFSKEFSVVEFLKKSTLNKLLLRPIFHINFAEHGLEDILIDFSKKLDHYISFTKNDVLKRNNVNYPSVDRFSVDESIRYLKTAKTLNSQKNHKKAMKFLKKAILLNPFEAEILNELGETIESLLGIKSDKLLDFESHESIHDDDVHTSLEKLTDFLYQADFCFSKAHHIDLNNEKANENKQRFEPIIEKIDQQKLNTLDEKLEKFYNLQENNFGFKKVKYEHFLRYIFHTNAIEGNSLSLEETRAIIETKLAIGGRSIIEQNEVLGLEAALKYLNSTLVANGFRRNLKVENVLELHRRVLGFVDIEEAGNFRQTQVFIADHKPPPPEIVPRLVDELLDWFNKQSGSIHPIELAALFHWKFVYIHPFFDGNGRTARLLMNLILMQNGYPPALIEVKDRSRYFKLIREANEGDLRPFIRFIVDCTEKTLDEYLLSLIRPQQYQNHPAQRKEVILRLDEAEEDEDSLIDIQRIFY